VTARLDFDLPWTEESILALNQETDTIDFKASAKLKSNLEHDLSRLVSAYANTAGGFIIFGIEDPVSSQPLKCDGGFPVDHKNGTRAWLENVVAASVTPPPSRFNVYEILPSPASASRIKLGHALYVIEIPASEGHARQALDGKYYAKAGSTTRVLGHYEVVQLNARGPEASASVEVKIQPHKTIDSTLIACFKNTGSSLIKDLRFELWLPPEIDRIGCFSCDESEFLTHDGFPWIRFIVPSLEHPLFKDQPEVRKWHLEYQSGMTVVGENGKWQLPPPNVGYSTLWIGNQAPIRQTVNLATAVTAPLFYQPERRRKVA
jgi:hypothetical protein